MLSAKRSRLLDSWILVIADDLTGALEAGAKFARYGLSVRVTTAISMDARPDVNVLVINTESRHLPTVEAALIVRRAAVEASRYSPSLVHKKTDSTLRGNIAAELGALCDVFPNRKLIYAPAYPEMGRTVRDGKLLLWGTPVHETEFAADLWNPVYESDIKKLLCDVPVVLLDGESDADLRESARLIMNSETPCLAVGPAALAEALAAYLSGSSTRSEWPSISRCVVVNGSLHPLSMAQIAYAQHHAFFDDRWICFNSELSCAGLERAAAIGQCVRHSINALSIQAIVVFGGDTASGIHRALDEPVFQPLGEIVQGVPLSVCGGMFWITKAGGFGEPDILFQIRRRLT